MDRPKGITSYLSSFQLLIAALVPAVQNDPIPLKYVLVYILIQYIVRWAVFAIAYMFSCLL